MIVSINGKIIDNLTHLRFTPHQRCNADINFSAQKQDTFEYSDNKKQNNDKAIKITLASVAGLGILISLDFICNHGKISKGLWNKIHSTEHAQKTYVKNIEQIQQHFSQIFGRDFSKDDAKEMAKKYRDIMRDNNINSLADKLFNQLKNDYGLEGVELEKINGRMIFGNGTEGAAATEPDGTKVVVFLDCIKNSKDITPKESLFESLCHELCHVRQCRILYRANRERLIDIISQNAPNTLKKECWEEILRDNGGNKEQAIHSIKNTLKNLFEQKYGNVDNLPQKTAEEIEELFNNKLNYKYAKNTPSAEYREQPLEKEAYKIGDLAKELLQLLEIK